MIHMIRLGLKRYKVYPLDLLVEVTFPLITVLLVSSIWLWLGGIGAYSPRELFLYTAGSFFLTFLMGSLAFDIEKAIRTGYFEVYQTKPVNYAYLILFQYIGEKAPRILSSLLLLIAIYAYFGGRNLLYFLIGLLLATAFYTLLEMIVGYLAAWYYKIWGLHYIVFYFPSLLLGGSLVPLDLLPIWVQNLSQFLPYRYLHYEIARTLLGHIPNLLPLLFWVGVAALAERALYRKMLRRLEAWGG